MTRRARKTLARAILLTVVPPIVGAQVRPPHGLERGELARDWWTGAAMIGFAGLITWAAAEAD